MLIDSHCHLDSSAFDADREKVITDAREAGVGYMLTIGTGTCPQDIDTAVRLAESHQDIGATVGVHPHDARKFDLETADSLEALCTHPDVLAIGEIGLDFHYDNSPREAQTIAFIRQMEIASAKQLPIVIHTRDAWDETLSLLDQHWAGNGLGGIMHCFSGNSEQALQCLNMGFLLSFAGILTFQRSAELRATARWVPLDRYLVETDAPYLTPAPYRKIRRNEPRFVVETARMLATVRNLESEQVAEQTSRNFRSLFDIPELEDGQ